ASEFFEQSAEYDFVSILKGPGDRAFVVEERFSCFSGVMEPVLFSLWLTWDNAGPGGQIRKRN
ncbi:MAG: hypothetical protein ACOC24_05720, partial [Desulfovibrionales bacterium]